ncbi:MAG: helix-turn-helix domain-containing protein [Candidatus Woesearchaeota archaeon]
MERILKELGENFNLNGKELLIIEELSKNKLKANQIVNATKIPKGRIYDHLNKLIKIKIIERSEKKPFYYSIKNLDENIIEFLKYNFDEMVQKQHRMMHLIEHRTKGIDEIEIVETSDDFSFRIIQFLKESQKIKNILRHDGIPFILYPENVNEYIKIRKIYMENREIPEHTLPEMAFMLYQANKEALEKNKNLNYIIEGSAIKNYLNILKKRYGKIYIQKLIKNIISRIKLYNIKLYILNEFLPMQIFITEEKVLLSIVHFNNTHGIIIRNKAAVRLYSEHFDEMTKKCKIFEEYIKTIQ